jgi:Fic family protein
MIEYYHKDEVDEYVWSEYAKTKEFQNSREPLVGIPQDHPIIVKREENGLYRIVNDLENELADYRISYAQRLKRRPPSEWVREWLSYHSKLFERVLKIRGRFRDKEVWFDTIEASEEYYKIPKAHLVPARTAELAGEICAALNEVVMKPERQIFMMAKLHFEFVRIHPFPDGNGRIARVLVDQICLALGLPVVMNGFPRADKNQRRSYHESIRSCCFDSDCSMLQMWIKSKLETATMRLA